MISSCAPAAPRKAVRESPPPRQAVHQQVPLDRATVVLFFPGISDAERGDAAAQAALDRFHVAVEWTRGCLRQQPIVVRPVFADSIAFTDASRSAVGAYTHRVDKAGCYLFEPDRQPMLVRANAGASNLTDACGVAAARYFAEPACCTPGSDCGDRR